LSLSIAKDAFWAWGLQLRQAVGSELRDTKFCRYTRKGVVDGSHGANYPMSAKTFP